MIRDAALNIAFRDFRREIFPDVSDRANGFGRQNSARKLAEDLSSLSPSSRLSALGEIIYKYPEVGHDLLQFADIQNPDLSIQIADILNELRPEDGGAILLEPLRPKSQAGLDALVQLAARLKQPEKQDIALAHILSALSQPESGFHMDSNALHELNRSTAQSSSVARRLVGSIGQLALRAPPHTPSTGALCELSGLRAALTAVRRAVNGVALKRPPPMDRIQ